MHINEKLMEKREDLLLLGKSSGKEREKKRRSRSTDRLPGLEVVLHFVDLIDRVLDLGEGLVQGRLSGGLRASFISKDLNLELHHLLSQGGHLVGEAEGVLAGQIDVEKRIPLPLLVARVDHRALGILHLKVNIKRSPSVDLQRR